MIVLKDMLWGDNFSEEDIKNVVLFLESHGKRLTEAEKKEKRRAYNRLYRATHDTSKYEIGRIRPKKADYDRQRYLRKRKEKLEYAKKYKRDFKDQTLEYNRTYYRKHKKACDARRKLYHKTVEGIAAIRNFASRRRARLKNCRATATNSQIRSLLKAALSCFYCGRRFTDNLKATLDHVVPISKGGDHSMENLVAACLSCNCSKWTTPADVFIKRLSNKMVASPLLPP